MKKEKQNNQFKNYEITFTTNDRYNPVTRTVRVRTNNEYNAIDLVHREHGSFSFNKEARMVLPTDKIKIDKVREVDEFKKDR